MQLFRWAFAAPGENVLTPQYLGYGRVRMEQMVPCGGVFSSPTVAYCGRRPRCALLEAKPLWLAALAWSAFVGRIENFGVCKRKHSHPSHHFAWEKDPLSTRLLQHRRLPLPLSPFSGSHFSNAAGCMAVSLSEVGQGPDAPRNTGESRLTTSRWLSTISPRRLTSSIGCIFMP